MFQVCIDDSATESNQGPAFVLAGYVARVRNWEGLAVDWRALLDSRPKLEYLKGQEANSRSGQFKGWTVQQRDKKLLEFVAIIKKYKLRSIRHTVSHAGFREHVGGILFKSPAARPRPHPVLRNPGYVAVSAVTCAVIGDLLRSKTREKVQFIFDEGVVSRGELERGYRSLMLRAPRRATDLIAQPPEFRDDKEFLPLQAADLLAFQVGREGLLRQRGEILTSSVWLALSDPPPLDASVDLDDLAQIKGDIFVAIENYIRARRVF